MREITFQEAVQEALREEFLRDEKTLYFGTNINYALREEFGEARVRGTPISESAFVGAAVGLAGSGFRPVVDIGMATFGFVAMDQMVNQAAKITYMFGGQAKFPIVYRMTVGTGAHMAAQHSISPYPMYMNTPGLKIILPSTPRDVKGLLKTAIRDNNPVIYFEHRVLGGMKGEVPEGEYTIPLGQADVKREGSDVTVVALARMVHVALEAAEEMGREGVSLEVIDPRTLVPLDRAAIRLRWRRQADWWSWMKLARRAGLPPKSSRLWLRMRKPTRCSSHIRSACAVPISPYPSVLHWSSMLRRTNGN